MKARPIVRGFRAVALPVVAALATAAHVGDSNTFYRGPAGPYTVQVVVRHPGVVPGLADLTVRVENARATGVTVRPVLSSLGLEGAPRPDAAQPVAGEPGLFAAQLWFMTLGTYSVHVSVEGELGAGTAIVPVVSSATRTLPMGPALGIALAALGLFLAVGLLTIVRAAVAESTLPPGEDPDRRRRVRARLSVAVAIVLLALVATGGRAWWNGEANAYRRILFEPLAMHTSLSDQAGQPVLTLDLADRNWLGQRMSAIVPDHGKMMHAFLVRLPAQDAFAHVHPERLEDQRFRLALPPLPAGRYALYSDIVHETGFSQTLVGEIDVPDHACNPCLTADPDDSWWTENAAAAAEQISEVGAGVTEVRFADGASLHWEQPAQGFVAGRETVLRFSAQAADGRPMTLDPYMGMAAHAAVRAVDGSVFVHLHPTGSISLAAQQRLAARIGADSTAHVMHTAPSEDGVVSILWAFPRAGDYRLWLQVSSGGMVRTAAWDVTVNAP